MAFKRKNPGDPYARRALRQKKRWDPRKKRLLLSCLLGGIAVVIAALLWGNVLKADSEAHRAAQEANQWLLDGKDVTPLPVNIPPYSAGFALPSGKMHMSDILDYQAVTFNLGSTLSPLPYGIELPAGSGMSISEGATTLEAEVARFHRAELYVIGVFTVTSVTATDDAERQLRQGQELALFSRFAEAGIDSLLLLGLPVGSDTLDKATTAYLSEIKSLWNTTSDPALGVALYPTAFVNPLQDPSGAASHAGSMTPGRLLAACDYLVLDLRQSGDQAEALLKAFQYPFVRYNLRLLTSPDTAHITQLAVEHGFSRILEFGK